MIRPTTRAVILFALSVPLAVIIVSVWQDYWYFSLYLPFAALALIMADLIMLLPNRCLHVELEVSKQLYVGQPGIVALSFSSSHKHTPVIQALLEQSGEAGEPVAVSGKLINGRLGLSLQLIPLRRGQVALDALWLRWKGPLEFIEQRRRQAVNKKIDVVPDVHSIHEAALQFFARDAIYGIKTQRFKGEGTEFESLCEYTQGMDNRLIDWKHSARHRKLLCKEFQQERNHQIVLGFDTGHLMLEPIDGMPKLDHAIKAGLLLSWVSLRNGDYVGGCGFDVRFRNFIKPGCGMPYFAQFQRFTSGLAYQTEETNFTVGLTELDSRLQRRALVILFTEFVDQISAELLIESLQLMVRRHVVIFVTMRDPMLTGLQSAPPDNFSKVAGAVTAGDFLRERSIVLERVSRLGVHCIDTSVQGISTALLNRYLMIKQRGLL